MRLMTLLGKAAGHGLTPVTSGGVSPSSNRARYTKRCEDWDAIDAHIRGRRTPFKLIAQMYGLELAEIEERAKHILS